VALVHFYPILYILPQERIFKHKAMLKSFMHNNYSFQIPAIKVNSAKHKKRDILKNLLWEYLLCYFSLEYMGITKMLFCIYVIPLLIICK